MRSTHASIARRTRLLRRSGWIAGALAVVALLTWWATRETLTAPRQQILNAIRDVESGGRPDPPDGNGGRNIGPYQISLQYWTDATQKDNSLLSGNYADCRDEDYAERVMAAYMRRYCPKAWEANDAEVIARTHHGGPNGASEDSTLTYWARVRALLLGPATAP